MNALFKKWIPLLLIAFTGMNCSPESDHRYPGFEVPPGFPSPVYNPIQHGMTEKGYALGRKLFYDPILSKDNSVSCEDCHKQWSAFADGNHALSHGVDNQFGTRNSPPIFNLAWHPHFMWDGGINHIEVMPVAPITNQVEMGERLQNVIDKLNNHPDYPLLFEEVFHTRPINSYQLLKALAWFLTSIVSADSKYDLVMQGKAAFTEEEKQGFEIFKLYCKTCHTPPLFTSFEFKNNGIDSSFPNDSGRARITNQHEDVGKFKVPSLRNWYYSRYYMHDGRFEHIDDVLQHYNHGIKYSHSLDTTLLPIGGFKLEEYEIAALKEFLLTLNDQVFIQNELYKK